MTEAKFIVIDENELEFTIENLQFKVFGFRSINALDTLVATIKVTLHPHLAPEYSHTQKLNLYDNDRLLTFCRTSATNLARNVEEITKGVYLLREKLEKHRLEELRHSKPIASDNIPSKKISDEAKRILKADNTLELIEELLIKAGLATETKNGLRLFLILLTRNFDKPLHVLLQGNSHLCKLLTSTVASVIPLNNIHHQTSMSASAIYYTKNKDYWKHKVLYLDSIDKNFKGAVILKEFIENNCLKRQTTESDYITRQLYASNKVVSGPICLMAYSENEEMNNRFFEDCFLMRIEENETNRKELLEQMKKENAGIIDPSEKEEAIWILREIQQMIKPVKVIIPFINELNIENGALASLRSFPQFLSFLKTISLLNQLKKKIKTDKSGVEYMEATPEHLETALGLFKSLLLPRLDLLGQTNRSFLESLKKYFKNEERKFTPREIIQLGIWSKNTVYRFLEDLNRMGYVQIVGGNKKKGIEYKVAVWDDYENIQLEMATLDAEIKRMLEGRFPQVSRKFPGEDNKTKQKENEQVKQK